ncbi:MAG: tRNA (adenosine(37)-N6)-threonylcarbamoyltransferase complex dimerization subunit type 1 TsaB [Candidatus Lambdaproteobacteria bacterium RIFOXYD1_FULL_56_27]|uniref:tRNA (Adenosine(37)-N6)-threonylcarbamoyltransferase complex dimerization subunit type 1 TsaB n=1 Tax=Candidatus Lambdaproteobacteria bacterium RIFOXYD2_FULL_56_26 TaxID=1817773 RepID=A0A1F6GQ43_9PROT|nr:MAG: tRNA (adenosine(37)-N6)-threonylcarbamoyltransferase complex dimerization subunit type 1 TsaB [Candidatus Lambdaproteobacteria bacterium RIFOXYD2_FULL_56_26]OGH03714.1 MAG: tRNA (adenosine(37)-N6)-threonylcarbamoyltransferase complex dimerization subunit type 1 TsaB [Candidatus Lambdaproteobacteria bacterium RIFOXYC1_FULL_56_13]OGH07298.1 MAG: tRNA (adenosine(37)-N6)-threonylcarbamoyltransferase complex dimerization subunit type 1 TsaB [Candidatus Lambdaproteobacteria bacterium RIFOXYD1_F
MGESGQSLGLPRGLGWTRETGKVELHKQVKDQLVLGVEASGSAVSVGLARGLKALGQVWLDPGVPSGDLLMPWIDRLLPACLVEKKDLEGLAVCLGPGSFTGMRIALGTVQALAFALQLPLYHTDRLSLAAATLPYYPHKVRVIQNAHKGELYHGAFDNSGPRPRLLEPLSLVTPKGFLASLQENEMVLGEGLRVLSQLGLDPATQGARQDPSPARVPDALGLIHFLAEQAAQGFEPLPLEPIYLRPSEAEIKYAERFGIAG